MESLEVVVDGDDSSIGSFSLLAHDIDENDDDEDDDDDDMASSDKDAAGERGENCDVSILSKNCWNILNLLSQTFVATRKFWAEISAGRFRKNLSGNRPKSNISWRSWRDVIVMAHVIGVMKVEYFHVSG